MPFSFVRTQTTREQETDTRFCSFDLDLDLDPMTLMYERNPGILKM